MKKILVIEDDREVRTNIKTLLEEEGYKVFSTSEGLEGISLAKEIQPNLIICDVMMEGINGFDVIKTLAEDTSSAVIPFIFLTAKVEKEDLRAGMELGADDYLFKPFQAETLLRAIQTRLNKYDLIRAEMVEKNDKDDMVPGTDKLFLKVNNQIIFIKAGDIKYISAENQYSSVFMNNGKSYLLRISLSIWEEKLSKQDFLRIHRSTIININFIDKIEKWFSNSFHLHLKGVSEPFVVSRKYSGKLKAFE